MERNGSASWLLECNILCYCHKHQILRNQWSVFDSGNVNACRLSKGWRWSACVASAAYFLRHLWPNLNFLRSCEGGVGGIGKTGGSNLNLHFHKIPLANQEARLQPQWYWCCLGSQWRCSIFSLTPHCRLASNRGERQYLDAWMDAPRRSAPI